MRVPLLSSSVLLMLIACGGSQAEPEAPPPPPPDPPVLTEPVYDEAGRPHLEHCVLHAGESNQRSDDAGAVLEAECGYNAECIARPGASGGGSDPTDGFIYLHCEMTNCTCTIESAATAEEAYEESFAIDEPCGDSRTARELLQTRCMVNAEVANGLEVTVPD